MPNSVFSLDAGFPQFTGQESEKQKVGEIYDYLIQLQQTLRYCLQNLGGDNFNDRELEIIGNTIREPVKIELKGMGDELAKMNASLNGITLEVSNGKGSANLTLKAGETVLSSQQIKLEGVVTFTAGEDGYSIIDGGRIYSEWIKTDYAWFTNDTEGIGHYINSMGMHFYKGKSSGAQLEVGSLYFHNDRLVLETRETSTLRISAAAAMEMMGMGDITIQSGGSINLKGNVFTNGERIVLERSPL